jgi:signal transduction histidine kinase
MFAYLKRNNAPGKLEEAESSPEGRFSGRDLSQWSSPRLLLPGIAAFALIATVASRLLVDTSTSRPVRGSLVASLSGSLEWGFSDIAGILAVVFVGLLPFLQAMRIAVARSTEGLSLWVWLLFTWTFLGATIQGFRADDTFLAAVSLPATIASCVVLFLFKRFGSWSTAAFFSSFAAVALTTGLTRLAVSYGGSFDWSLSLAVTLPLVGFAAAKIVSSLLSSSSRRGSSQAVHLIGTIGYAFWFIQAVQTSNIALASVSIILAAAFAVGLAVMVYLGVISDDGVSATEVLLFRQVKSVPRAIAMHRPVFNRDGVLVDMELVWANDNWQSFRVRPVPAGSLASEHRVRFLDLVPYLRQAWDEGRSVQFFKLDRSTDQNIGLYNYEDAVWDAEIEVETVFVKMESGMVMEWGDDLDAKVHFGSQLEQQRRAAEERRQALVAKIATQNEQSRFHMALHDNILQELFIIQIGLEAGTMAPMSTGDAERARAAVAKVSKDIRSLIEGSKNTDDLLPLDDRIVELLQNWAATDESIPQLKFSLRSGDATTIERLPVDVARSLFHITKESVANALKHADASEVTVTLSILPSTSGAVSASVSVVDNGVGIDPDVSRSSGLSNMAERASSVGGLFRVADAFPGNRPGTSVEVDIPHVELLAV